MCAYEELISIIFRLFSFGVLIFLCGYTFKRYLLPILTNQLHQEQEEKKSIQERHKEIQRQKHNLSTLFDEQEKLCAMLQEKVQRWQRVESDLIRKREAEKEKRILLMKDRIVLQELEFTRQKMLHTIAPQALENAQSRLSKQYNTADAQRAYEQTILTELGSHRTHEEAL